MTLMFQQRQHRRIPSGTSEQLLHSGLSARASLHTYRQTKSQARSLGVCNGVKPRSHQCGFHAKSAQLQYAKGGGANDKRQQRRNSRVPLGIRGCTIQVGGSVNQVTDFPTVTPQSNLRCTQPAWGCRSTFTTCITGRHAIIDLERKCLSFTFELWHSSDFDC